MGSTRRARRCPPLRACACGAALVLAGSASAASAGATSAASAGATSAASAGATSAASAGATSVAARDTFSGAIVSASGALSGDRGTVTVLLHVESSANASRPLGLTFRGGACGPRKHCVRLSGTATGSLRAQSSIPDVGRHYAISAGGRVAPLGRVEVTGSVNGTGFIRRGREGLRLVLKTSRGTITVSAQSAELPGQTSP